MNTFFLLQWGRGQSILLLTLCLSFFASGSLRAQTSEENWPPVSRPPRIRLFCVAPGFRSDPVGLQDDDEVLADIMGVPSLNGTLSAEAPSDDGPDWIQVGMGSDNPYFELRRPGHPGGVGYYRINTQVQLFDSPRTSCALGLQAVTPLGIQYAGLPDGPTVVSPSLSVFHALDDGITLQGYVAKNVALESADLGRPIRRELQYGLAVQRPLITDSRDNSRGLFLSVGALAQVYTQRDNLQLLSSCDVLPGLHWQFNDNWWVSSGVLVPVGTVGTSSRPTAGQWQFTCSFQF